MRKILFFIGLLLMSCLKNSPTIFCNNELQFLKGNSEETINIDFSLQRKFLVEYIQSQTHLELCTYPLLNARFKIPDTGEYNFPLMIFKNCKAKMNVSNTIKIFMDRNNNIRINNRAVEEKLNLKKTIRNLTQKMQSNDRAHEIIYLLDWDLGTDIETLKYQVLEILKGIIDYVNEQSMGCFSKKICSLQKSELEYLDHRFKGIIGISEFVELPPPPPPPPR